MQSPTQSTFAFVLSSITFSLRFSTPAVMAIGLGLALVACGPAPVSTTSVENCLGGATTAMQQTKCALANE